MCKYKWSKLDFHRAIFSTFLSSSTQGHPEVHDKIRAKFKSTKIFVSHGCRTPTLNKHFIKLFVPFPTWNVKKVTSNLHNFYQSLPIKKDLIWISHWHQQICFLFFKKVFKKNTLIQMSFTSHFLLVVLPPPVVPCTSCGNHCSKYSPNHQNHSLKAHLFKPSNSIWLKRSSVLPPVWWVFEERK